MSKRGRPRKPNVERDDQGRIKASVYRDLRQRARQEHKADMLEVARLQRIKTLALSDALDPRMESMIGRMYLVGHPEKIDAPMLQAGFRLMQLLFIYDVRVLKVYRGVRAQDIARQRGLTLSEDRDDLVKSAANAYATLLTVLGQHEAKIEDKDGTTIIVNNPGHLARATFALCRDNGEPSHRTKEEISAGIIGLKRLANYWGLYDDESGRIRRWKDREAAAAREARILMPQSDSEEGADARDC